jgi:hypothetical protein
LLIRSEFSQDFEIDIVWNPLKVESRKEQAEINLIKAQTDEVHIRSGVIAPSEGRDRLIADETSGYDGLEPIDLDEEDEEEDGEEVPDFDQA